MNFLDINVMLFSLLDSLYSSLYYFLHFSYSSLPSFTPLVMLCFVNYYTIMFFYTHYRARKQTTTLPMPSSLPVEILAWLRGNAHSLIRFLIFDLVWHGHLLFKDFKMPDNQITPTTPLDPLRARIKTILQNKPLKNNTVKLLLADQQVQSQIGKLKEQMRKMKFVCSHPAQTTLRTLLKNQRIFLVLFFITLPALGLGISDSISEAIRHFFSNVNIFILLLLSYPFLGPPNIIMTEQLESSLGEGVLKEFKQRYETERSYYTKYLSLPTDTNITFVFLVGLYGLSFIDESYRGTLNFTFFTDFVKEFSGGDRSDYSLDDLF